MMEVGVSEGRAMDVKHLKTMEGQVILILKDETMLNHNESYVYLDPSSVFIKKKNDWTLDLKTPKKKYYFIMNVFYV